MGVVGDCLAGVGWLKIRCVDEGGGFGKAGFLSNVFLIVEG